MQTPSLSRPARGFLIIETLVALLVLSLGILGMTTLMGQVTGGAAESKDRSTALALAKQKLDEFRNNGFQTDYTTQMASGADPNPIEIDNIKYRRSWRVDNAYNLATASSPLAVRKLEVNVEWDSRSGATLRVSLDSAIGWNDPVRGVMATADTSGNVVRPTGSAIRGTGRYTPGTDATVSTNTEGIRRLLNSAGETILYLQPNAAGKALNFTVIKGRVLFDEGASNMPAPQDVHVRLSSEGQCVYKNLSSQVKVLPEGSVGISTKYKYFDYTCYVGPGWYGNVGIQLPESSSPPTVCVGDPGFTDSSRTANPVTTESAIRSYRGFREETIGNVTRYVSTGTASSTRTIAYGDTYGDADTDNIRGGSPVPSDFPTIYTNLASGTDYFRQDFLVSRISGTSTCAQRMSQIPGTFSRNAGKNYCIRPDNWTADNSGNRCPPTWPGSPAGCVIEISGSFNAPNNASQSTTSFTYSTSANETGSCIGQGNSANFTCSLTGGAGKSVTITARISGVVQGGAQTTQTCTRTATNVGCSSISGFNIDSATASCQ